MVAFTLIYLQMQLTHSLKPYSKPYLNNMDVFAHTASSLSIIMGMLFIDPEIDNKIQMSFMVLIMGVNVAFIVYWGIRFTKEIFV